jgi:hypothetical protein
MPRQIKLGNIPKPKVQVDDTLAKSLQDVARKIQEIMIGLELNALSECLKKGGTSEGCSGPEPPIPFPLLC